MKTLVLILLSGIMMFALFPQNGNSQTTYESIGSIQVGGELVSPAGFEDNENGKVCNFSTAAAFSIGDISLSYKYLSFCWENVKQLPFGNKKDDPWENLHEIGISYEYSNTFLENWGVFIGAGVFSNFEKEMSDSYGAGGYGGLIYYFSQPDLTIRLGVGACYSDIETEVLPFIGFDWNTHGSEGFTMSIGFPSTMIAWRFNPATFFALALESSSGVIYKLAENSPVEKKGYFEMEGYSAKLSFTFSPFDRCSITLGGAVYFESEFKIYDDDGQGKSEYDVCKAGAGIINIALDF